MDPYLIVVLFLVLGLGLLACILCIELRALEQQRAYDQDPSSS